MQRVACPQAKYACRRLLFMKKAEVDEVLKRLSATSITLLRMLRAHVALEKWDTRKTVQANRMGLLKLKDGKLWLSARGEKVADRL